MLFVEADHITHEGANATRFVNRLEYRHQLLRLERRGGKDLVAFEKVFDDAIAIDSEQIEEHRRADTGAVAARRTMKEQRINVGLSEQSIKSLPVGHQRHHQKQMLFTFLAGEEILVALFEPHIAHRDVLPSHILEQGIVRASEMRHLDAAL